MKYPQVVSMPSAVSDWLEEQLEARGIDSVVYTRYILSLLHRDSTDLICPDQDSCFTHSCKEVRKSGASRKRFRRTSDWWTYNQADVDQLKRSAAVECLMSASDQKWGIESLVDELCEKLKEINNDSNADIETVSTTTNYSKTSPQELANQYYAAFPPLTRNSATNSPGVITLIPKWIASPKKKQLRKVDTDHIKAKVTGKSRFNYTKKSMGYSKKTDGGSDWELHYVNNVRNKGCQTDNVSRRPVVGNKDLTMSINNDMVELQNNVLGNIRGLLESPQPDTVAAMNSANVHDTARRTFIPFRTDNSSIWSATQNEPNRNFVNIVLSQYDTDSGSENDFELNGWHASDENMAEEKKTNDFFENSSSSSSSSSVFQKYSWNPFSYGDKCWSTLDGRMAAEENTDTSLENSSNDNLFPSSSWNPFKMQGKWSGAELFYEQLAAHTALAKSFQKLNHRTEKSSFAEVPPRATLLSKHLAFCKTSAAQIFKPDAGTRKVEPEKDKEDLLTSLRSHFKPIKEKTEVRGPQYADGTTFVIPSTLDKINYKRSESGTMYIDSEYGFAKKYSEYKTETSTLEAPEFVLKFNIRQNDKGCQTDFESSDDDDDCDDEVESAFAKKDEPNKYLCTVDDDSKTDIKDNWMGNSLFSTGSRPSSLMQEIIWSPKTKHCNKCNKDIMDLLGSWNLDKSLGSSNLDKSQEQGIASIWNGGDVFCVSCLRANSVNYKPLNQHQTQLRDELSDDADELFSDLRKVIAESRRNLEVSCYTSEPIEPADRKRRLANFCEASASWSFASRLKEDHLIQMSTLPTFRSAIL